MNDEEKEKPINKLYAFYIRNKVACIVLIFFAFALFSADPYKYL